MGPLFGLMAGPATAADETAVTYFRIGTGSLSGTYFPVGETIANLISKPPGSAPCEPGGRCGVPGLVASAQATEGSLANVDGVAKGTLDAGLAQADIVDWAWTGTNMFSKTGPLTNLRAIANLYRESVHVVASRGSGITSIRDLKGKRVSLDVEGSGTAIDARAILAAYGLREKDMKVLALDAGRAADAILAGEIDAFFFVGGWPAPSIVELADKNAIVLVPIDGPEVERLVARQPFLARDTIPPGAYSGLAETPTVGVGAQLVVSAAADPDLIYALTRALFNPVNAGLLARGHPRAAEIRLSTALDGVTIPLHPGAARFYRAVGLDPP